MIKPAHSFYGCVVDGLGHCGRKLDLAGLWEPMRAVPWSLGPALACRHTHGRGDIAGCSTGSAGMGRRRSCKQCRKAVDRDGVAEALVSSPAARWCWDDLPGHGQRYAVRTEDGGNGRNGPPRGEQVDAQVAAAVEALSRDEAEARRLWTITRSRDRRSAEFALPT